MGIAGLDALPTAFALDHDLRFTQVPDSHHALAGTSVWSVLPPAARGALYAAIKRAQRPEPDAAPAHPSVSLSATSPFHVEIADDGFRVRRLFAPIAAEPVGRSIADPAPAASGRASGAESADAYFERADDLLCILERDGRLRAVNPAWGVRLGLTPSSLIGARLSDLVAPDDRPAILSILTDIIDDPAAAPRRFRCRLRDSQGRWRTLFGSAAVGSEPGTLYAVVRPAVEASVVPVTPSPSSAPSSGDSSALGLQPGIDQLTDLPNRAAFEKHVDQLLGARPGAPLAVLYIDLDRFKPINEALGHSVGDRVLQIAARRLTTAVGDGPMVARIGSDEFLAALPGVASEAAASPTIDRLLHALQSPCHIAGVDLFLTASVGLAFAPQDAIDARTLVRHADRALLQARLLGRGTRSAYESHLGIADPGRLVLENRLGQAVSRGELLLHYQPQVRAKDGRLMGFEALARWHHHEHGFIPPATFIPLAEETGLIVPMGQWILDAACRQAAEWRRAHASIQVSVNLSARQLADHDLPDRIRRVLDETSISPESLDLELTESAIFLGDPEHVRETLLALKKMGIGISVDDFGTGYSNFVHLSRLPVDRLKIDRSFITDVAINPAHEAVVRAIVDLAHTLGLQVVAEGVENDAQRQLLTQLGCDHFQGYYFAPPLPPSEIPRLIAGKA